MELSFVRSEEQMRTQVELQPADVERLKKQADEFDRQVRQPVLEGARERQDQANKRLDGKRKAFDPRIKPGALVMVRDQNRKSKWSPALIGPFLVNRQSKRALTFYLENFSKKKSSILPRPFPVHHLVFVDDTSLPVSSGSGKAIPQLYGKKAILKIVGDRTAVDGSTEYKVVWRQRGKRDSWLPASSFEMKYIADHVRKSRSFKKRKLVRKAAQQSPYSH
jgi:hypothetical protein